MNFVIISPHFPETYWKFAEALKANSYNVLGIGDAPYHEISKELKGVLTEYYFCPRMTEYPELYKAFAFFSFKYGKIDWVESNNEYWLASDARLRSDFNLATGVKFEDVIAYKSKTAMKKYFTEAGVRVARHIKTPSLEEARAFVLGVGYPLFAKPDIGVGANSTYRISNDEELAVFFIKKEAGDYIIEEYVDGTIVSFDGISNSHHEPVIYVKHLFPVSNATVVSEKAEDYYYSFYEIENDLETAGRAILKAFNVYKRFFHLEFFRLNVDREGLGKQGDLVALEVNMRPPGGFTTDMISACLGLSSYRVYSDVIAFDENRQVPANPRAMVVEVARRDAFTYALTMDQIAASHPANIVMRGRYSPIISVGMGNDFFIAKFSTFAEAREFKDLVLKHQVAL
ncbi:MAG: carbamoylphosphate synthase large subunit [Bacilli bacterium]|jgi:hypothetical protein